MLLLARTTPVDKVQKRHHGISTLLIDLNEVRKNDCTIQPIDAMVNHNTTEVFFDDVPIPADALIGEESKGFRYILDGMNAERCLTESCSGASEQNLFAQKLNQLGGLTIPTCCFSGTPNDVDLSSIVRPPQSLATTMSTSAIVCIPTKHDASDVQCCATERAIRFAKCSVPLSQNGENRPPS